ncbi:DUF7507 domain-containing protein [Albidovulum inexpectatum]|uniref:DUF7507 domain-containing protein n=1 Tax=Albidovulum inexpectatum TaxID=196587 RepID=UPI0014744590|nr:SdrD B-like domain-containing protein [Albidovulum inexpectatum]
MPAGTAAGSYTLTYELCSEFDPAICDSATVTVVVAAAPIDAVDDALAGLDGLSGATSAQSVLDNDTLNGSALTDLTSVSLSIISTATPINGNPVPLLDATDGTVTVPPGTPQGDYTIVYEICEKLNPTNCDTASVTISIQPVPPIAADDTLSGLIVGNVATVDILANDADPDGSLNPTTVSFVDAAAIDTNGDGWTDTLFVPGEGTWSADLGTGEVSFTPEPGFTADPTPVDYTVVDNDGNPSNPATITLDFDQQAGLTLIKSVVAIEDTNGNLVLGDAGDTVTYRFDVTNSGNVRLATVTVDDAAIGISGLDVAYSLDVGATAWVDASYVITPADEAEGYITNVAVASAVGVDRNGVPFTDGSGMPLRTVAASDAGTDTDASPVANPLTTDTPDATGATDGIPDNDPTVLSVPVQSSDLQLSGVVYRDLDGDGKFSAGEPTVGGHQANLVDDQGNVIATTIVGPDGTYGFAGFPAGTYSVVFVEVDDNDPSTVERAIGRLTGLTFDAANRVIDDANLPLDPSGVVYDSSSGAPVAGVQIRLTDASGTPLPPSCLLPGQQPQTTDATGSYRFDILPGADPACPAGRTEYRLELVGVPSGYLDGVSTAVPPQAGALDVASCPDDAIPGGACQPYASATPPSDGSAAPYYVAFILGAGDPHLVNNHLPIDPVLVPADPGTVSIEKTATVQTMTIGQNVPYVITVTNNTGWTIGPVIVRDVLPAGMIFTPGSVTVDSVAETAVVSGQSVVLPSMSLEPNATVEIRLTARVASNATAGELVNRADVLDAVTGEPLAPTATATVRLMPEHVFDCSDVIGTVFDDADRDGYQDGPIVLRGGKVLDGFGREITDPRLLSELLAGRDRTIDQVLRNGEAGIPGARVVTPRGVLITTDEHGRFHVPCAELPRDIGSNFTLKLDPRSLPTGYRVTTENPRTIRLTAGKMAKLNFGASIDRVVDIDLTDAAFERGSSTPKASLASAIAPFVARFAHAPAVLRISYLRGSEDAALIRDRLDEIESRVRAEWRRVGRGKLIVERTIKFIQ